MTALKSLREAVDQLSEEEAALWLLALEGDPVARFLVLAPIDDEPETDEERGSTERGRAELRAGRGRSTAEVRVMLHARWE